MQLNKNTHIVIFYGGKSAERDVSLKSGTAVYNALTEGGYQNVRLFDPKVSLWSEIQKNPVDVAFNAMHGRYGEDGSFQGFCEFMGIPYTGCRILGSALSIDKAASKKAFTQNNVKTPVGVSGQAACSAEDWLKLVETMIFPVVVKPVREGSTFGISKVNTKETLIEAIDAAGKYDSDILVEEFIEGTELTVAVINGTPLPVVEIAPKKGFYDYAAKYTKGETDFYCPARIDPEKMQEVSREALAAAQAVYSECFCRVDLILSHQGVPYVLEVNTVPGLTETSLLPLAAQSGGISFLSLIENLLTLAIGGDIAHD